MTLKNEKELEALREIGRIVAECLRLMSRSLKPGMSTLALDEIGREYLRSQGARSAPEVTYQFPGATCISLGHEAAHGIPSGKKFLKAGELVNIDVSAEKGGFFADTGGSFIIPTDRPADKPNKKYEALCEAGRAALEAAIQVARAGAPIRLIGQAIEEEAKRRGFTVIRNLGSHGVGRSLHEEPGFIPNYFDAKDKRILKENQVITIEPFVSTGATWVEEESDGWTLSTEPRFRTVQYEHSMVITKGAPILLTV